MPIMGVPEDDKSVRRQSVTARSFVGGERSDTRDRADC